MKRQLGVMDHCLTCLGASPHLLLLPIFSIRISYFTSCLISFLRSASPPHICMFFGSRSPALEPELSWGNWCTSLSFPTSLSPTISLTISLFSWERRCWDVETVRLRILKQWLSWIGSGDTFRGTWSAGFCCSSCIVLLFYRIWAADDFISPAFIFSIQIEILSFE